MFNSSIFLSRTKTNKEIRTLNSMRAKLMSLQRNRVINNFNIRYLKASNKFKNKRILNENVIFKKKLKLINNLTNFNDTSNSFLKSDFSSSENAIKRALEFHNNANLTNETFFTKKDNTTFLTENNNISNNNILPSLNFNPCLSDYLRNNNLMKFFDKSIQTFKEKNRIQSRINYINNLCKNLLKTFKKNDYYDKFEKNVLKYEKGYNNYKYGINNYLTFLQNEKIKEENIIITLKNKKGKLLEKIKSLNKQIDKLKTLKNEYSDIKNFLLKVKGIKEDPDDNNTIKEVKVNIDKVEIEIKPDKKSSKSLKKFQPKKNISESVMNFKSLKLHLSPIKQRKNLNNIMNINKKEISKSPLIRQNKNNNINNNIKSKFNNIISKSINIPHNKQIFSSPDEFINTYDIKMIKMRNSLNRYYNLFNCLNSLKSEYLVMNELSIHNEVERNLKEINSYLKQENLILINKLSEAKQIKMNKEFKLITKKVKKMLLIINSYYDLKKKFNIDYEFDVKKKSNIIEQTKEEKNKNKNNNLYLLQLIEKIIDILKGQDKKYKEDPKFYERYRKIKIENENIKFEMIRKKQINNLRIKQAEKNKKILEYHRKTRFYHLNKNGITLNYFNNSNHYCISSSSKDELIDRKILNKKEEIKNLIFYN